VKTISIAPHVLADLSQIGVSETRVKKKVLALANEPGTWKSVEKWAVAGKRWEQTHAKKVRERCCYATIPSNRVTLHPVLRRLFQRFSVSVIVELAVDFYVDRGVLHANVTWFTERNSKPTKPKPR